MANEDLKEALREIARLDFFKGEVALENQLIEDFSKSILNLNLDHANLSLEYAEMRGAIRALKKLQTTRASLVRNEADPLPRLERAS